MIKTQPAAHGIQLLRELQLDRSVPKYNADALSKIEKEMRDLENGLKRTILYQQRQEEEAELRRQRQEEQDGEVEEEENTAAEAAEEEMSLGIGCGIVFQHQSLLRNKRCVLAYHYERMKRLRKLRWGAGAVQNIPNFIQKNMSDNERQYLDAYDELLREYTDDIGLDLFSDVTPPKDVFVEVKVIKDDEENSEGVMTMESGVVKLQKHQRLFLRRVDAEMLMQKGLVEHVSKRYV